eukprot:scaffold36944_cov49-Attheya_sp.AAC.1
MKRQIMHMYKHKYVPISFGKAKYKNAGEEHSMYGGGMAGASKGSFLLDKISLGSAGKEIRVIIASV